MALPSDIVELDPVFQTPWKGRRMFRNIGTIAATICAGFLVALGVGLAPSIVPPSGELGVFVGAAFIAGIGVCLWVSMSIVINREAIRVAASSEDLEVTLRNKTVIRARWSDPAFALNITLLEKPKEPNRLIWLDWKMPGRMTATLITKAGEDVILRRAAEYGITSEVSRSGKTPYLFITTQLRAASR